jgi:hypothetical protein
MKKCYTIKSINRQLAINYNKGNCYLINELNNNIFISVFNTYNKTIQLSISKKDIDKLKINYY